jgi:hypothetical protein
MQPFTDLRRMSLKGLIVRALLVRDCVFLINLDQDLDNLARSAPNWGNDRCRISGRPRTSTAPCTHRPEVAIYRSLCFYPLLAFIEYLPPARSLEGRRSSHRHLLRRAFTHRQREERELLPGPSPRSTGKTHLTLIVPSPHTSRKWQALYLRKTPLPNSSALISSCKRKFSYTKTRIMSSPLLFLA